MYVDTCICTYPGTCISDSSHIMYLSSLSFLTVPVNGVHEVKASKLPLTLCLLDGTSSYGGLGRHTWVADWGEPGVFASFG